MSLSIALQNALSGLTVSKTALDVISNNIANVNTEGYTRKVVNQQSAVVGGEGRGVQIDSITRNVNDILLRQMREQTSTAGAADVESDYFSRIQDLFGTLSSDSSLGSSITKFATALNAASVTPEDTTVRANVVQAATTLVQQLNDMASKVQTLRADADKDIADSLNTVNGQVKIVADLNIQISRAKTLNQPVGDLEDKRDVALSKIANQIGISTFSRGDDSIVLMTSDGQPLVDVTPKMLSHTPAATLDSSISYPGGITPITLNGNDITTKVQSGRVASLVDMRDTELPNLAAQLDQLASTIRDTINQIHNAGAGDPPPTTLTGTKSMAGGAAAPIAGTGTVRIAVVNADGTFTNTPLDLDLSTVANLGDVVTAINTGLSGQATASINTNNQLVITATDPTTGIALNEGTSSIGGKGFSYYLGLNDFFVTKGAGSIARQIAVRPDIVASPQSLAAGTLNQASSVTAGVTTAVASGDSSVLDDLNNAFNAPLAFSSVAGLPAVTTTFAEYANQILSNSVTKAAAAQDNAKYSDSVLSDIQSKSGAISGVNMDEELANLVLYQTAYAASARVVSAASDMMQILENLGK